MSDFKIPTPSSWQSAQNHKKYRGGGVIVGVLAMQGDFLEHIQILQELGVHSKPVKLPGDLEKIDAIILPGGESTVISELLNIFKVREPLRKKIKAGMPVWGTCAGMIMLAKNVHQDKPKTLELMDITVSRNAYGRQLDSFETRIKLTPFGNEPITATFIRAPIIERAGKRVKILGKLKDGTAVAVRQNNMLATSFHPELSGETKLHEYFISLIVKGK